MDTKFSKSPTYKRILLRVLRIFMIVGVFCALISCKKQMPSTPRILQKDDNLNSMVVTTGIKDAPPLEAFCNFEIDEDLNNTIDCQVPLLPKLAIGHMIGLTDGPLQELDWSKVDWQITLDGYLLDLDTFEDQSYVEPVILSSPSPVREGFQAKRKPGISCCSTRTLECIPWFARSVKTQLRITGW